MRSIDEVDSTNTGRSQAGIVNAFARDFKLSPRESVEFVKLRSGTRSSKQWHGELGAFSDFKSEQQLDRAGVGCGLQCSQQCFACDGNCRSAFAEASCTEQQGDAPNPQAQRLKSGMGTAKHKLNNATTTCLKN